MMKTRSPFDRLFAAPRCAVIFVYSNFRPSSLLNKAEKPEWCKISPRPDSRKLKRILPEDRGLNLTRVDRETFDL